MKMIRLGQGWIVWVAPAFRIEMQTKDQIGMQLEVHQSRPASNLTIAVEQNFALPADSLLFVRIIWIKNVPAYAGLWHAVLDQNFSGKLPKIIRTLRRSRFITVPGKENYCAEFTQSRGHQPRHAQSQFAFLVLQSFADLEPTLLHLCPFSAWMPWIERNF